MKRKENDLNQTSRELCSMLIFRGVMITYTTGNGGTDLWVWWNSLLAQRNLPYNNIHCEGMEKGV